MRYIIKLITKIWNLVSNRSILKQIKDNHLNHIQKDMAEVKLDIREIKTDIKHLINKK